MKVSKVFSVIFIFFNLAALDWVDFDASMRKEQYCDLCTCSRYKPFYNFFKHLYVNFKSTRADSDALRIPRITHHICLGRNGQWPAEYQDYLDSWITVLPAWQHMIWFDHDVEELLRAYPEWAAHYYAQTNWGARADVARYVILWVYGGLYADWDQECLRSFDDLHYICDLYVGIQPLDTHRVQLGIGVIGSIAGHPLLKRALDEIDETVPFIIYRTGPLHFTIIFYNYVTHYDLCSIALPPTYFYPCGYDQKGKPKTDWLMPESLAVHHWAGSWLTCPSV